MLSNKLKIKQLATQYRVIPLFFCVKIWEWDIAPMRQQQHIKWYDHLLQERYLYDFQCKKDEGNKIFCQQYWLYETEKTEDNEVLPFPFIINKLAITKDYFASPNGEEVWNFWLDAIYDPCGQGKLKPNAQ